ncbi:MAG: PaaI family thioesterase [Chloroflexi bacterium]|nr:MAG: PaaI family thioesterase [Chloroflexota bacterium]
MTSTPPDAAGGFGESGIDPTLFEQYCFGCGRHNPIGLHLGFARDGDGDDAGVVAYYTPRREDQGFPEVMHGGLLSLLLDEAMGWAMYADRLFAVTAKMELRYRRPVGVESTLTIRARITRQRGRRIEAEATITDEHGVPLVDANALFIRMSPDAEARALASFRASGAA